MVDYFEIPLFPSITFSFIPRHHICICRVFDIFVFLRNNSIANPMKVLENLFCRITITKRILAGEKTSFGFNNSIIRKSKTSENKN